MENIEISTEFIKLDQLLKFAGIVQNGADAKYLIVNGYVFLNGEKEIRRGKKIYSGDTVKINFEGQIFEIRVCEKNES